MHTLPATLAFPEPELSELRLIMERNAGVLLRNSAEAISRAAVELMESHRIGSVSSLLKQLYVSDAECEALAERLLVGETGFFRYLSAFKALATIIRSGLETRKSAESPGSLRIWSAGCSTGEEAYSIAMSVCEVVNRNGEGRKVRILASDIRRGALEVAERGLYPKTALTQVPPHLVPGYFAKVGEHCLVKPRLRNLVTFGFMNLAKPAFLGQFDCIFCMDVLPHFSTAQRAALVQRLHLYLQPGGYLFLGEGEKLPAVDVKFHPQKTDNCTVYQKPAAAAARSGR